jgi:hypothetical protein
VINNIRIFFNVDIPDILNLLFTIITIMVSLYFINLELMYIGMILLLTSLLIVSIQQPIIKKIIIIGHNLEEKLISVLKEDISFIKSYLKEKVDYNYSLAKCDVFGMSIMNPLTIIIVVFILLNYDLNSENLFLTISLIYRLNGLSDRFSMIQNSLSNLMETLKR